MFTGHARVERADFLVDLSLRRGRDQRDFECPLRQPDEADHRPVLGELALLYGLAVDLHLDAHELDALGRTGVDEELALAQAELARRQPEGGCLQRHHQHLAAALAVRYRV